VLLLYFVYVLIVCFSVNLNGTLALLHCIWISTSSIIWSLIDYIFTEVIWIDVNHQPVVFSVHCH